MKIDIISVVPGLLESPFAHSIMKRAKDKGLLEVNCINLRDYTTYARAQVDDYQFGGGAGMVMMMEPLVNAIESLQKTTAYDDIIFLTPDGETFNQKMANHFSLKKNLLMLILQKSEGIFCCFLNFNQNIPIFLTSHYHKEVQLVLLN